MAIDSAAKRLSALHHGLVGWRPPGWPDGTIDQGDRQSTAGMYAGVLAGEPEEVVSGRNLLVMGVGR